MLKQSWYTRFNLGRQIIEKTADLIRIVKGYKCSKIDQVKMKFDEDGNGKKAEEAYDIATSDWQYEADGASTDNFPTILSQKKVSKHNI